MNPIRLLLVDDHALVRAGLRAWLQDAGDIAVIGEAGNGSEALAQIATLCPDVVLMDIIMPELSGLDATARVAAAFPDTRVLILSRSASEEVVLQALRSGAAGYLVKTIGPAELIEAIRAVAGGKMYLSPAVSKHVVAGYLQQVGTGVKPLERLTPRQIEILKMIAEGCRTKEIAQKLKISVKTVEMHRSQLMKALEIHDLAGLVRYAIRIGLVTLER